MISWKLINKNKRKYAGIFGVIMLCVIIVTASFLYIMYASEENSIQDMDKYGDISAVLYVDEEKEDIMKKLSSLSQVSSYVGQARYIAESSSGKVILHVMDFEAMNELNDMRTVDGTCLESGAGLYIEENFFAESQSSTEMESIKLIVSGEEMSIPLGGVLDKNSFCEVSTSSYLNAYMDVKLYESFIGTCKNYDAYYIALSEPTSKNVSVFLQQFENYPSKNIIELVELEKNHSSQSFIYAVSFILIGLLGVVLGGLYNFTKGMMEENISQISFFRTIGLSRKEATKLYMQQILWIGGISEVFGVIVGTILGNIVITLQYGFSKIMFPNWLILVLTSVTSLLLPYFFMAEQSNSLKKSSPIRLLLDYRNKGYNIDDDGVKKYVLNTIIYGLLFVSISIISEKLDDLTGIILKCVQVFVILNFVQYLCTVILAFVAYISKPLMKSAPYTAMALRNTSRNKKKVSSVIGIFVLILSFDIGMYDVFYTIRVDTVNKVEQQYQADAYISEYNQTEDVIMSTVNRIENLDEVEHIETSCTRYLLIEGNQIEGYFLSEDEFSTFLNVKDIETGEKVRMSSNKNEVVIGKGLAMKGKISVGDTIEIEDDDLTYKVIVSAICNATEYQGNVVFINEELHEHAINTINLIFKDEILIQDGIDKVYSIFEKNDVSTPKIKSKQQLKDKYRDSAINGTMFIECILFFITTVGILMLLNQELQFMKDRKREYALFHTLGNDKEKLGFMYLIENLCILFTCLLGGILAGVFLTSEFVDVATFTAGITEVLSYYYDISVITKMSVYVTSVYILCIVCVINNMKKKVNVYDVTNE